MLKTDEFYHEVDGKNLYIKASGELDKFGEVANIELHIEDEEGNEVRLSELPLSLIEEVQDIAKDELYFKSKELDFDT